ncbi:hypothetical protein [Serratia fonticola]|uniref:hypothetical protein n=1 Tax=Serratia fonticola TaxID=47917 RepID=UPI0027FB3190|nr:hypothetical protein [Serratia fonticola]MDQ7209193.1 hypothetical protein [Serratia fonticola]HBE9078372.1 hypothetical protein [Serratia fonticola]HBE9083165.1 hypothetical protein [Serratia fonticola]HBE9089676.1 hypothetical protein [Serratia fonticola]HBE9151281.1 hypothetical protein [Serratia fonticola]
MKLTDFRLYQKVTVPLRVLLGISLFGLLFCIAWVMNLPLNGTEAPIFGGHILVNDLACIAFVTFLAGGASLCLLKTSSKINGGGVQVLLWLGLFFLGLMFSPMLTMSFYSKAGISSEWIKRSVSQVLANPWGEQQSLGSSYSEDNTSMAFYLVSRTKFYAFLGVRKGQYHAVYKDISSAQKLQSEEAIRNVTVREGALLQGDFARFFSMTRADNLESSDIAIPSSQLPESIRNKVQAMQKQTINYASSGSENAPYTALDIAIAVEDKKQAEYLLDFPKAAGPIQRLRLFHFGLGEEFENKQRAQNRTATIFPEMAQKYYLEAAQENMIRMAYYIEKDDLSDNLSMGDYTNLLGRYQPYDYFVANAFCDANYATFLQSLGISTDPLHFQNLQTLIVNNVVDKQQCSALMAFYEKL